MADLPSWRVTKGRRLIVAWLLAAHAVLVLHCSVEDFATYDEIGNLTAGLAYWQQGDYRLYSVNPPLSKMIATLPVLPARPETAAIVAVDVPGARPEWDIGDHFARANAERYHGFVVLARLAGIGWSLLGACLVYRWAGVLWGNSGGLLALAIWSFEPNIIAHAHLITPDVPGTVAGACALYMYRRYLLEPSWAHAYTAGLVLGVAQLCKFTLVVLYPVYVVLWLAFYLPGAADGSSWHVAFGRRLAQIALLFATCLFTINLGYEFAGTCQRLEDFPFVSRTLRGGEADNPPQASGNRFRGTWLGRIPVPLPEDYVRGVDVQRRDFEIYRTRHKYLRGEWRTDAGWWYYYLYAAAVKVPLGLWGLLLLALLRPWWTPHVPHGRPGFAEPRVGGPPAVQGASAAEATRPADRCSTSGSPSCARQVWRELLILWLPALSVLALTSSQRTLQSHFRYVLPMFPMVIVFLGSAAAGFADLRRWLKGLVVALLGWAVVSYLSVHPHSLAYFNELAGGPDGGHEHLLGSNIDWGQDLFRLRRWLAAHPEAMPLQVAYWNHIDPRIIGLEFEPPPYGLTGTTPPPTGQAAWELGPHPGYFAVSVSFVHRNPTAPPVPDGRGGYRFVRDRSFGYFQHFLPIAKAGYSIFLYHITLEEANAVRGRYGLPLLGPNVVPGGDKGG